MEERGAQTIDQSINQSNSFPLSICRSIVRTCTQVFLTYWTWCLTRYLATHTYTVQVAIISQRIYSCMGLEEKVLEHCDLHDRRSNVTYASVIQSDTKH